MAYLFAMLLGAVLGFIAPKLLSRVFKKKENSVSTTTKTPPTTPVA